MFQSDKMPGAGSMADTFEFIKKMWGGAGMPGVGVPTLSVEELNKKIGDLKAVESWLELNMNMLRGTIQTLEVQSATISTLQSMSAVMTARAPGAAPAPTPFGFADWPPTAASKPAAKVAEPPPAPEKPFVAPAAEPAAENGAAAPDSGKSRGANANPQAVPPVGLGDPAAWWNMLQDQFKQAVGNAMQPLAPDATTVGKTAGKTAVKKPAAARPAAKAAAKPAARKAAVKKPLVASKSKR